MIHQQNRKVVSKTETSTFAGADASLSQELRMATSSDTSNLVQRSQQKDTKSSEVNPPEEDAKVIANESTPKQRLHLKGYLYSSKFVNCCYFVSGLLAMGFATVTLINNNRVSGSVVVYQIVHENQMNCTL